MGERKTGGGGGGGGGGGSLPTRKTMNTLAFLWLT